MTGRGRLEVDGGGHRHTKRADDRPRAGRKTYPQRTSRVAAGNRVRRAFGAHPSKLPQSWISTATAKRCRLQRTGVLIFEQSTNSACIVMQSSGKTRSQPDSTCVGGEGRCEVKNLDAGGSRQRSRRHRRPLDSSVTGDNHRQRPHCVLISHGQLFADRRLRRDFPIDRRPNDKLTSAGVVDIAAIAIRAAYSADRTPILRRPTRRASDIGRHLQQSGATDAGQVRGEQSLVDYIKETTSPRPRCTRACRRAEDRLQSAGWDHAEEQQAGRAYAATLWPARMRWYRIAGRSSRWSQVTENVDPAKILANAPGERNEPARIRRPGRRQRNAISVGAMLPRARTLHQGRRQRDIAPQDGRDPGSGRAVCLQLQRDGPEDQMGALMDAKGS